MVTSLQICVLLRTILYEFYHDYHVTYTRFTLHRAHSVDTYRGSNCMLWPRMVPSQGMSALFTREINTIHWCITVVEYMAMCTIVCVIDGIDLLWSLLRDCLDWEQFLFNRYDY